jgi:hypothetical protein
VSTSDLAFRKKAQPTTHPTFDQCINHPLHRLSLPQQAFLNRHHPQLPPHDGFAPIHPHPRRKGTRRPLAPALLGEVRVFLHGRGHAHVAVGLGLYSDGVVFEVTVGADARVEVDGVVLEVLRGVVSCVASTERTRR